MPKFPIYSSKTNKSKQQKPPVIILDVLFSYVKYWSDHYHILTILSSNYISSLSNSHNSTATLPLAKVTITSHLDKSSLLSGPCLSNFVPTESHFPHSSPSHLCQLCPNVPQIKSKPWPIRLSDVASAQPSNFMHPTFLMAQTTAMVSYQVLFPVLHLLVSFA